MTDTTMLHFWGHSDDLVEIDGDLEGCDEYPLGPGGESTFLVQMPDGNHVDILATYGSNGCWWFAASIEEELERGHKLALSASIELNPNGYSLDLKLMVPVGTVVTETTVFDV